MIKYLFATGILLLMIGYIGLGSVSAGRIWPRDPVSQMVFFAVLEGLYTDGVSNETVDLIIPRNPITGKQDLTEHFVDQCPLCAPALEAFRLYRMRQNFSEIKLEDRNLEDRNTFGSGSGIGANLVERLKSNNKLERLETIQGLIDSWVNRRLNLMHLTPEERSKWSQKIEARRKEGMKKLFALKEKGKYQDWGKFCAICDGTAGACKLAN